MNFSRLASSALLSALIVFRAHGYEIDTHEALTEAAADQSVLQLDVKLLPNLGIDKGIRNRTQLFPNSENRPRTILELLRDGSNFEDKVSILSTSPEVRVTKHFYNPITGLGLNIAALPTQSASPDWALARRDSEPNQKFSYWDARQHLFDALTKPAEADRKRSFGLAFQTLGQVLHHLQDMAQPAHVRNEMHCDDALFCGVLTLGTLFNPSLYEQWTDLSNVRSSIIQQYSNPSSVGYDITGSPFTSTINSPRRFWHTEPAGSNSPLSGKGIAEFTNRNYLSAGTNFLWTGAGFTARPNFPSPAPSSDPIEKTDIRTLMPGTPLQGEVWFIGSRGYDNLIEQDIYNPRAATFSIFSEDLRSHTALRTVTLNRFNFQEAYRHLIPRAVAYSAGMINYFFRGKLDLKRDEQDSTKFRIINLGPETMNGRFALYYDAKDANRYPVQVDAADPNRHRTDPNAWRLVIAALDPAVPNSNLSEAISFIPPAEDGSPTSPKTPNEYMLVFSGDMGEERTDTGAIGAVVGKKISKTGALLATVYGASGVFQLYRSSDLGDNWEVAGMLNDPYGRMTYIGSGALLAGRALSLDAGATWSSLPAGFQVEELRLTAASVGADRVIGVRTKSNPFPTPSEVQVHFSMDKGVAWSGGQTIPGLSLGASQPVFTGNNRLAMQSTLFAGTGPCPDFPMATCNFFEPGFFASNDGGATWSKIFDGELRKFVYLGKLSSANGQLVPDPNGSDALFANTFITIAPGTYEHRFLRSLDGGTTWAEAGFPAGMAYGPPSYYTLGHLVYAGNRTLLAYFGDGSGRGMHRLFRSTDYGATWQEVNAPPTLFGLFGMTWVGSNGAIPGFE